MEDKIKVVLDSIEAVETRINTYWNFYTIVVLAVIGWLMSSEMPIDGARGGALIVTLVVFFLANLGVIRAATQRALAYEAELNALATTGEFRSAALRKNLSRPATPGRMLASYLLHVVVDIAVIYAILNGSPSAWPAVG